MLKVKQMRIDKNVKQIKLAELTGNSPANYSKKENGSLKFDLEEAKILADFFDTTIENIFFENDVSKIESNSA